MAAAAMPRASDFDTFADTAQKALNVAVFTPLAIYTLRGQKPPDLLVLAALVTLAVDFTRDVGSLMSSEALSGRPPSSMEGTPREALYGRRSGGLGAAPNGSVNRRPGRLSVAPPVRRLYAYRVNRSAPRGWPRH